MGVKNLWDILDSCKKKLPLHHLQNKKLCVDLSCWLVQLHTAHRSPDKVYLKNLFHRIRALIALNCTLIFVTDGAIPLLKLATYRRRLGSNSQAPQEEANSQPLTSLRRNKGSEFSCMIKEAKQLGMALGIPSLDGVEEAEAQCALLDVASLCDGCFTSDSDTFLFGARTVYRDVFIGEEGYVICYEMEDIEKKLGFGRNSLISLAVLLGCDYSNGVPGFGPEKACRLVKSVGDETILDHILSGGVKATRKCKGKHTGISGDKVGDICSQITVSEVGKSQDSVGQFHDIVNAYLAPKCHSLDSEDVQRVCCQHPFFRSQLHQICEKYFDWTPEKTDQYILPKIAERELRKFSNLRSTSSALGTKPSLSEIPVPCPVSAIVKQRKAHGSECYEVSWRNIDGLQLSVVPGDLVRSACPEKITEFLEKKAEEKKKKRRERPKKPAQAAVRDVDAQLQELLIGIELESNIFQPKTNHPQAAEVPSLAPGKDVVDLSSPSPPLRACKIAKSQRFTSSTTATVGIDLHCHGMLTDMMESQSISRSDSPQNCTPYDDSPIDLSLSQSTVADTPGSLQDLSPCHEAERRALSDISNSAGKANILPDKHEGGTSGGGVQLAASRQVGCSWKNDVQKKAETTVIDLSSPSPVVRGVGRVALAKCDEKRRNKKHDSDVLDICGDDDGGDMSPDHARKARELRLFLDSIRDELY